MYKYIGVPPNRCFSKRKDIQIEVFLGAHNVHSMYNCVIFASLYCWLFRLFAVVYDKINKNVKCVLYLRFPFCFWFPMLCYS
jgi:hypothetical protein